MTVGETEAPDGGEVEGRVASRVRPSGARLHRWDFVLGGVWRQWTGFEQIWVLDRSLWVPVGDCGPRVADPSGGPTSSWAVGP